MEQDNFWSSKEAVVNREKWEMMPLKDLPVKEMRNSGYGKRGALGQADYAARLDTPDWQVLLKLKKEGINFHVPDVQYLRRVGWALKVRFRCDLAEKNYEEALETAKTMFALARHFIDHPS
jgi:hypothetical protein